MAQKAMLFDSSRCTGCQACAAACGRVRGAALPAADMADAAGAAVADGYQRTADLDGDAVLAVTFHERVVEPHGLVWEIGRKSCVHCAAAPCAEVCPTGALACDGETGFVTVNNGRCVGCHLCALVCPADVLRHGSERGSVVKCDGCLGRVRADMSPFCVEACPFDALLWGEREEVIAQANERAAWLRERGFERACVLGIDEQGGHGVIQVLKYGAAGGAHEALASTGETSWIGAVKMAGPVSVGVLGAAGAGAVAALAIEMGKERRAHEGCKGSPIAVVPGLAPIEGERASSVGTAEVDAGRVPSDCASDDSHFEDEAYLDGDFTDEDAAREAEARRAREAAEREAAERGAAVLPRIVAATPAAAAAATAVESHLYPVAFDDDDLCGSEVAEVDEPGDTGEIPVIGEFDDTGEIPLVDELGDTGEIPIIGDCDEEDNGPSIDELSDTGELYNLADFQRLLAADIVAHHLAKEAAASPEVEGDEGNATDATDAADAADAAEKIDADEAVDTTETPADE